METGQKSATRPSEASTLRHREGGCADLPLDLPIEQHGIVLRRSDQQTSTNVPHLVTHHSPTGYEWGFGGSGPADLALNILEWHLRREGYHGETVPCYEGRCFRLAWDLHQAFKRDVIAVCDREDAHISLETVTNWLATYRLATAPLQRSRPSP
jgi:hypothetical protein